MGGDADDALESAHQFVMVYATFRFILSLQVASRSTSFIFVKASPEIFIVGSTVWDCNALMAVEFTKSIASVLISYLYVSSRTRDIMPARHHTSVGVSAVVPMQHPMTECRVTSIPTCVCVCVCLEGAYESTHNGERAVQVADPNVSMTILVTYRRVFSVYSG